MKWLKELFFPTTKVVTVHEGVHPMQYQALVYAFEKILGEDRKVATALSECLTVHPTSGLSEDVQIIIKNTKTLNRLKSYLKYHGIDFTEE